MLDVPDRVDVRGDGGDALVDEELDHLGLGAGLAADAGVDAELAARLDRVADEPQHGGVELVEPVGDVLVVAVDRERVLREVVGAEGGEVDAGLGELLYLERARGRLDHHAPAVRLGVDPGLAHVPRDPLDVRGVVNQGEHHFEVVVPHVVEARERGELLPERLGLVEAPADPAPAEHRVVFGRLAVAPF